MKTKIAVALTIALLSTACAYHQPNAPSATTAPVAIPAKIALNIVPGIGSSVTQAAISAVVSDANGLGIGGVLVTFSTTGGTLAKSSAITGSDGLAQNTLTAVKPVTVTASAGSLSTSTVAAIDADLHVAFSTTPAITNQPTGFNAMALQPSGTVQYRFDFGDGYFAGPGGSTATHFYAKAGSYNVSVTAVDTAGRTGGTSAPLTVNDPPVVPTPIPTPTPTPVLSIALECTPAKAGFLTGCHVVMTGTKGEPLTSTITSIDWDWGDGMIQTTTNPPSATATHPYAVAGSYLVIAKATAPAGVATAQITITILP